MEAPPPTAVRPPTGRALQRQCKFAGRSFRVLTTVATVLLAGATASAPLLAATPAPTTGWTTLFDQTTTSLDGFHVYNDAGVPLKRWKIEDGVLHVLPREQGDKSKQDLVITSRQYANFELELEWKVTPGANSGILYKVVEDPKYKLPWFTGLEDQVLDNKGAEDNKLPSHLAGSIYDMVAPTKDVTRPIGEWNTVRISVRGNRVKQWLNGELTVKARIGSEAWLQALNRSKYKNLPDFAPASGVILLQDHGHEVWFRNIRIRELPAPDRN